VIIATAGHVDHGKTTLVQALTGVAADQAPEARARGMTIDLGFASGQLDAATRVAFIDVPGHERFVRNMLAGVAAIDLALLVVAADDGPMPQTREHLAILGLLGLPRLVVVLSKIDRVTPQRLAQATGEAGALLAGSRFAGAPVFALAATSGLGLDALRSRLVAEAAALAQKPAAGRFRLAIDRSFAVAGSGRVVTGAVLAGVLQVGDAVQLSPQGSRARVRALQVLNQPVGSVCAGQRCAVNLAGADLKRVEPQRGDWLVADGDHAPSSQLDVLLQQLPGPQPLPGPRAQLLLHLGAASRVARLAALGEVPPQPGHLRLARLQLDQPVSAAWGDRFILRDAAANRTLAGGRVIDAFGPQRGRAQPQRLAQLAALALDDPADALQALLQATPDLVDLGHFAQARGLQAGEAAALHQRLQLQVLTSGSTLLGLTASRWHAWRARLLQVVDGWHAARPDSLGPDEAALRQQLDLGGAGLPLLRAGLQAALADGDLLRDGLCHRRPGHQPVLAEADAALLARVTILLQPAGLRPPIVGDLALQLGLPLPALHQALARLVACGLLVRLAPNRYYLPATVAQLEAEARALAAASADGAYDAAAYRDRTGIGRNLTVQVLEFLDRVGITRFDGARRRLRA
jgi:selenocysteine-specific elongation factor